VNRHLLPGCVAIGIFALLGACAEDAFVSYDHLPKLVVQGRLSPDTSFQISITSSLSPVDPGEYIIPENMAVSLISSTGSVVDLYRENNLYVDPQAYPIAGESYFLIISAPGYARVEAQTSIPQSVQLAGTSKIANLRFVESEMTPDKMNLTYDLILDFMPDFDPHDKFFHFIFVQTTSINAGTATEPDIQEIAYYINPQFPDEDGFYQQHETGVLIDAEKTGASHSLAFSFVDYTLGDDEELGNLFIEVRTVTEEYYQYHTSLSRQLISRDDPFAEPIPVFNNVRDGSGNFSGFSRLVYQIPVVP